MIPVPEEDESEFSCETNKETGINITEQINSSGMWTSLAGNTTSNKKQKNSESSSKKKSHGSKKRMSVLKEDENEEGITIKASSKTNKGFSMGE
jgi:hypothetical protein